MTAYISRSSGLRSTEEELGGGDEKPGVLFELALVDERDFPCDTRIGHDGMYLIGS